MQLATGKPAKYEDILLLNCSNSVFRKLLLQKYDKKQPFVLIYDDVISNCSLLLSESVSNNCFMS